MSDTQEQQLLREPDIEPTDDVISKALGAAYGAYTLLIEGLKSRDIQVDWRYYNDGKRGLEKRCIDGRPPAEQIKKLLPFGFQFGTDFSESACIFRRKPVPAR